MVQLRWARNSLRTLRARIIMATKFQTYYCYLDQGTPVILKKEPVDFAALPARYVGSCPNSRIAFMTYQANLRIMKLRSSSDAGARQC